jgi:hypoxanthine phosphoribosyltransferase
MEKHQENAKLSLYQNTNYTFERMERKTLIIDVDDTGTALSAMNNFNIKLHEPLIIDKLSDIYLDSFTTSSCVQSTKALIAFVLTINEFNNKNNSNNSKIFNSIIIPNEESDALSVQAKVHKGKKMNYICSINPTKLRTITGKIQSPDGVAMFSSAGRFIAEFIIVARDDDK